jgi:hypothetical protein
MVRISRNNLSEALKGELDRLSTIGDVIGGVDFYGNMPANNLNISGGGLSLLPSVSQIKKHDLIIVADATEDSHGLNAIYEADTAETAGDDVAWVFVYNMETPQVYVPVRTSVLTSNVPAVVGTPPVLSTTVKAAWDANPASVEVLINGLSETGFTIDSSRKLQLTGYTVDGWTSADTVEVFAWL